VYRKQVRRRRAVLVGLIVLSLLLVSAHFTEAESGPLHAVQRATATVLSPLEELGSQALKPARDLVSWFDETFEARGENEDLHAEVASLRAQLAEAQAALGENDELRAALDFARSDVLAGYEPAYDLVSARVVARSSADINSTVSIGAGSGDGVRVDDPVVTGDGLVGRVSAVSPGTAQVQLITDHRNAVSAKVLPDGPQGVVEPEAGNPGDLRLDFVDDDEPLEEGRILVTAGWTSEEISSAYPYGIRIGRVSSAAEGAGELQQASVEPFVDLRDLETVQILTGGPDRPGVDG
jgi:rod shape-determining protein MreC